MAEFRLHLELERASGVLASIVAKLAKQGLDLKSQKLERATEGRGGTLDILAEGENDDIASLAENMAAARGVGQVVRIERDKQPVFFDGEVIEPAIDAGAEAEATSTAGTEGRRSPFEDQDDVDAELDEFLEPDFQSAAPGDAARTDAGVSDTGPAETEGPAAPNHGWLETDPEADQPPALHPGTGQDDGQDDGQNDGQGEREDDEAQPTLGRVDRPEPEPEPEPEPAPDVEIPATGWGEEAEDDWNSELDGDPGSDADTEPEPRLDMLSDLDEAPEGEDQADGALPRSETEHGQKSEQKSGQAPEPESKPESGSDNGHSDRETSGSSGKQSGVESIIRRRRRRRR